VWLVLVGVAFVALTIVQVPIYILLKNQLAAYQSDFASASDRQEQFSEAKTALERANAVATLLTKHQDTVLFSSVQASLDKLVPAGVEVASYSFTRKGTELGSISISGEASTRSSLSDFRSAIENDPLFKSATLPLANLAKDRDIPFSISIIPEGKESDTP
jgi:Tfp pilus assembly protein PilN